MTATTKERQDVVRNKDVVAQTLAPAEPQTLARLTIIHCF
jgi:hypothetical protein